MGVSFRRFLIDQNEELYCLPGAKFERMLRDPTTHCLPRFAGTRVRMANLAVETLDRQAIRVVWSTFGILTFDGEGYFDPDAFERQQWARAELALAPPPDDSGKAEKVVDAASRFVAQGGSWTPSKALARRIDEVALGRVKCVRL